MKGAAFMSYTQLYFAILILILIICILKKISGVGLLLVSLYALIGYFAVMVANDSSILSSLKIQQDQISMWPYLFLIGCYLLYLSPFLKKENSFRAEKQTLEINNLYLFFSYGYIICSIITLLISFPTLVTMVQSASWAESYAEESVIVYSNIIQYIAINICSYFRILALVCGFTLLINQNRNTSIEAADGFDNEGRKPGFARTVMPIVLIVCAVGTGMCSAILSTSRSMIYEYIFMLIFVYVFNYRKLGKKIQRFFIVALAITGVLALVLFTSMTISRFETRGTYDNVISYLGQSPVVFNTQVMGKINSYMHGQYAFQRLFSNESFNPTSIGGSWGSSFYTFVGWIYIDWGALGTIIIGCMVAYVMGRVVSKERYYISDVFLVFSYIDILVKGVFVIGRMQCYSIVATILIYIILHNIFDKYVITIGDKIL